MTSKDVKLKYKKWGVIFDKFIFIENNEVRIWKYNEKEKSFETELDGLIIADNVLNIDLIVKGQKGSYIELTIMIDGKKNEVLKCEVLGPSSREKKSTSIIFKEGTAPESNIVS